MSFDPNYIRGLSGALDASSLIEQQLSAELSSGLRVASPSDDPAAAARAARLGSAIAAEDRFAQTSATSTGLLQVTDSTLGEVVSQVTRAISLAVSASNGTASGANLQTLATELSGVRDAVLSLANTSYQGQPLFSGSSAAKPFTLDSSVLPATVTYSGDAVVRSIATPSGVEIAGNVPGASVFQAAGADVLGTLNTLIAQLSGGDATGAAAASATLTAGLSNIAVQRSLIGSSLSRLQSATSYAATQATELQAQQSSLVSADAAQVATGLSIAETQHQALLSVVATLSKGSLFDYLH